MEQYDATEALIDLLNANNVDCIFYNPGGDQRTTIEAVLKRHKAGELAPRLIQCLDESVALAAAQGHYLASGKPQFVMVHSELGTMRVCASLHNANWGRAPIIIWAGIQARDQRVNWMNEPHDQARTVRDFVKWDHEIKMGEDFKEVLQRAFKIAFTEPCGLVYLTYPRELLTDNKVDKVAIPPAAKVAVSSAAPPDVEVLSRAADILIEAENPLIMVGHAGRHHQSVALMIELAETLCAPVLNSQICLNFPSTHPLSAGFEQIGGSRRMNPYFADADVILFIDYDLPYSPARPQTPSARGGIHQYLPRLDAKFIHIDLDPLTVGRRLWGRGADIYIEADSREAIPALNKIINQKLTPQKREQFSRRFNQVKSTNEKMWSEWNSLAMSKASQKPISPDWLCHCIAEIIDEDTIVVNHTVYTSASVTEQIHRTKPGTLFGVNGGSWQWAVPGAFGIKMAAPDKTVVSLATDGGFVWGCPTASLYGCSYYQAPILVIIFNNQGYATRAEWDIPSPPDYELIGQACGAYGRRVEDPSDVLTALREAMDQVRSGRPAVVNVWLERRETPI